MIKAVLLDVDNTLLDFDACAKSAIRLSAEERSLTLPVETFSVFRRVNDRLWAMIEAGTLTREELLAQRWDVIFRELGLAADGPAFEASFIRHLASAAEPVDGAMELLEYLHGRYILAIASNAPYAQQIRRLSLAGFLPLLDHLFISEKIGRAKPCAAFFDHCIAALAPLNAQEIIMIGDSPEADIQGAAARGLKTCWFDYRRTGDRSVPADYTAERLEQIRAFL